MRAFARVEKRATGKGGGESNCSPGCESPQFVLRFSRSKRLFLICAACATVQVQVTASFLLRGF